jgi:hypothetical protein
MMQAVDDFGRDNHQSAISKMKEHCLVNFSQGPIMAATDPINA